MIQKRFKISHKIVKLEQGNNLEVTKSKAIIKGDPHSEGRKKEVQKMHTKEPFPYTCFMGYSYLMLSFPAAPPIETVTTYRRLQGMPNIGEGSAWRERGWIGKVT